MNTEAIIKKYTERLNTMKENRANEGESYSDMEMKEADRQIQMVAEFITDLKTLGAKKKLTRFPTLETDRGGDWKDIQQSIKAELHARQGMHDDYFRLMNEMYLYVQMRIEAHNNKHHTFLRCGFTDDTIWIGDVDTPILMYIKF